MTTPSPREVTDSYGRAVDVARSRLRAMVGVAQMLVLAGLAGWIAVAGWGPGVILGPIALFFSVLAALQLVSALRLDPLLAIDDEAITMLRWPWRPRSIQWSEVTAIFPIDQTFPSPTRLHSDQPRILSWWVQQVVIAGEAYDGLVIPTYESAIRRPELPDLLRDLGAERALGPIANSQPAPSDVDPSGAE